MVLKGYKILLLISLLTLGIFSFVRFFNNLDSWIVDIFSHFTAQYALAAFVLLSVCLWKRTMFLALLAGAVFLLNASALVNTGESIQASTGSGSVFKVYSANIYRFNKDLTELRGELEKADPDIVVLLEVTPDHLKQLDQVIRTFPYHVKFTPVGSLKIGLLFLSKFPLQVQQTRQMSAIGNVLLEATLDINGEKTAFYAVHYRSPLFLNTFSIRKKQFLWLAREIAAKKMPVIIAGDFNATPFSPTFRNFLRKSGLKDSREGFGWQPSWPTSFPLFWIPIDHILVSPGVQVHNRATGSYIGSDHYPVFADLSLTR